MADPYNFDTDPDTGSEKFVTDPDPDQTFIRIRIQAIKDSEKSSKFDFKKRSLLNYYVSINNHLN